MIYFSAKKVKKSRGFFGGIFHRSRPVVPPPDSGGQAVDRNGEKPYNILMFQKLYQKLFPDRYYASPAYRREAAARYDSKLLKYVTERGDAGDVVIAKDAYICTKAGWIFVNSETESLFKCRDEAVQCGELMSHDGVILTGFDEILGQERSIICYFKYYR